MLFETDLKGHRMEYIHHIYLGMLEHNNDEYIIVVPKDFEEKKKLYEWPLAEHIKFIYIQERNICHNEPNGLIQYSLYLTKILAKYIKQEKVDCVFLISLIGYIVALPFLISPKVKVVGIIYNIYLYIWDSISWKNRLQNIIKYIFMRMTPCLKTVFILNDNTAAFKINKLYLTNKFKYINDPYNELNYEPHSLRNELKIADDEKVFLHFGGLAKRKGTLDILNAIALLPIEQRKKSVFIFAGKIYDELKDEFNRIRRTLPDDARLLIFDEFCTNEFFADLCISSDFVLAPYHITNCSSGLFAYAATYGIPVIGPDGGLLGNLIKQYKLGTTLSNITPECIARKLIEVVPYRIDTEYKEKIKVKHFIDEIFLNF